MTDHKRPRIMVIDDEEDILSVIKSGLENTKSFEVYTFSNAEDALSSFLEHPLIYYDIVLTDIRMPKMDGFELYKKIKEKRPEMKIAFITAFEIDKNEFVKVIPSMNSQEIISKPVRIAELARRLNLLLSESYYKISK